jgi:predicted amidohydrolase
MSSERSRTTPALPADATLRVALLSEVFVGDGAAERLTERLRAARAAGAELVVLPELPLDPWAPATKEARDEDAEEPEGPRHRALAAAARAAGVAVLGGAIVRDPESGARRNTALLLAADGRLLGGYAKLHLPDEEGFWETCHYRPGDRPPAVIGGLALPLGVQICSDVNRPVGTHLLAAAGAAAVLAPRATDPGTWERWKLVLRANALTGAVYVLSVNRPRAERGVPLGGPSIAIAPDGQVLVETTDPLTVVTLEAAAVARARQRYPGYVALQPDLYAEGWRALCSQG